MIMQRTTDKNISNSTETATLTLHLNRYEEEIFLQISGKSKFNAWCRAILFAVADTAKESSLGQPNKYFMPKVEQILERLYLPTIALWTNLMLGDMRRHLRKSDPKYESKHEI